MRAFLGRSVNPFRSLRAAANERDAERLNAEHLKIVSARKIVTAEWAQWVQRVTWVLGALGD